MSLAKQNVTAALILAILAVLSWLPRLNGPIDLRWDGGAYYVLGTSLAEGKGYRLLSEPGDIQTTLHPPLLPVIVAIHQKVLGTNDMMVVGQWLRRVSVIVFVAYVVGGYFMLRMFLPINYAFLAALVCLFQLHTIFMSDLCFPEIPFGLATVLFTICNSGEAGSIRGLFKIPLAVVSYALRTIGIALFAAWVFESVCKWKLKQAAFRGLISLVPLLCWAGYIRYVESGREYKQPAYEYQRADYNYINVSYANNLKYKDSFSPELGYATLVDRVKGFLNNLRIVTTVSLGEAVSTREPIQDLLRLEFNKRAGFSLVPAQIIRLNNVFLAALIVAGIGVQVWRKQYFIPLYILFSVMAICITPWPGQFNRYLTPLAFFLSLSLFLAVQSAVEGMKKRFAGWDRTISLVLKGTVAGLILASQIPALLVLYTAWDERVAYDLRDGTKAEYRLFFYQDLYSTTDAGLDWLKRYASSGGVLAATDPQWAYLRTGFKTVLPPFEIDAGKAQHLLDSVPVKFLVVDESAYRKYTASVVAANSERWQRIYAEARFEIYERTSEQ